MAQPSADLKPTIEETTLLIDGDTIAYIAACAAQKPIMDFDGYIKPMASAIEGETIVDNMVIGLMRDLGGHHLMVFLSDPEANWRNELMPTYKQNRDKSDMARPMLLAHLKQYLRDKYGATHLPSLEADDVLGIVATDPKLAGHRYIVVGKDKDFQTIPGLHHQLDSDIDASGKRLVREVTPEFAQWFHYVQTLAGDRVDGYPGCPGIGMERAKRVLEDNKVLEPEHGVVTRGDRKGQRTTKWVSKPSYGDTWKVIVSQYLKAGLKEKDALLTARMARILQWSDYDLASGSITLWVPPKFSRGRAAA